MSPFLDRRCPVEQGSAAYEELKNTGAYTVLLEYPNRALISMPLALAAASRAPRSGELRVSCIGAGSFARAILFPALT